MECAIMEHHEPSPTVFPAEQTLLTDTLLPLEFMETVSERLKKRQRPRNTASPIPKTIRSTNKRRKTQDEAPGSVHDAATQDQADVPAHDLLTSTPGALAVHILQSPKMPTPPVSDDGNVLTQSHDITDAPPPAELHSLSDVEFATATRSSLLQQLPIYRQCVGRRQTERTIQLLSVASPASQQEGPWLDEQQVSAYLAPDIYHDGPVFLKNQQPMPLVSVNELCAEFYDDDAGIWIQDPAMDFSQSTREVRVGDVKTRLRDNLPSAYPWNCLEMSAPFEDGLRPRFLNTEECRLLTKIKIPNPEPFYAGAKVGRRVLRHGYKEAEKWVLLAQSGALTEPHQDSHGYNTYITVNQGMIGYGWMHRPTAAERQKWIKSPQKFIAAQWRYRVLRPGDTVYFPAGTVHFVFRHPDAGHTLAFGGHVLRCSTIVPWIETIKDESGNPEVTNEELTLAAFGYLDQVGTFVEQALRSSDAATCARWGGRQSIETFLKLKASLVTRKKPRSKARRKSAKV